MDPQEFLRMRGIGVGKKLVGDAQSGDVRAGKTFSNAQGNDKQGTMPVRSLVAQTVTPGVNNIIKQAGIYDGDITIEGDPDLVAANIKLGANIFGVAGGFDGKRWANGSFTGGLQKQVTGLAFTPSVVYLYTRATSGAYETQTIFGNANKSSIKTDTSKIITAISTFDTNDTTNVPDLAGSYIAINGTTLVTLNGNSLTGQTRVIANGFDVYCYFNTTHYWEAYE